MGRKNSLMSEIYALSGGAGTQTQFTMRMSMGRKNSLMSEIYALSGGAGTQTQFTNEDEYGQEMMRC